ncbi:hypothetical protein M527_06460 [Sphingobium indicum IP26]|uniref:Uncharacterized protein n=1 Tax=Sphingobium indicum F2 TaxID=1450518 RepID=A0A8E1C3T9_9SPHN|nr:hypothetical protein [Sphingobium indicum]EPR09766.1 hypothetical protein M527_06460 [Sphingobium indicum IP26]KER37283.1 hypothetical protein AL00_06330 [Sphingobium indicum F2]
MVTKKQDQNDAVPSQEEIQEARKEGVLDRVRETATTQDIDQQKGDAPEAGRFTQVNVDGTNQIEHLTDLGLDGLKEAIDPKKDEPLAEEVIAKLLILERNGKNRTDFVKLMMDRLKIKDIRKELPQAGGPDYTNDVSAVSKL